MNTIEKTFRRLEQSELIAVGDYHSLDEGENIFPILNQDTIDERPGDFSRDRSFWRLLN